MHALILADLEGIINLYNLKNLTNYSNLYNYEIYKCVEVLIKGGIKTITICDAHNEGDILHANNIINTKLESYSINIFSKVDSIDFNEKYDFCLLIGFHGMNNSLGILPHTLRYDFESINIIYSDYDYLIPVGEVELYTRWLGSHNIPVILVTGDREAVYESLCFNPYREVCCVKSLFETEKIKKDLYYDKLERSIDNALALEWDRCIATDNRKISVNFKNVDTVNELYKLGYNKQNKAIIFNNCRELVEDLYPLIKKLNIINRKHMDINETFINKIKGLVKDIEKEKVINSKIKELLLNNIISLDERSRNILESEILKLIES